MCCYKNVIQYIQGENRSRRCDIPLSMAKGSYSTLNGYRVGDCVSEMDELQLSYIVLSGEVDYID